MSKIAAAGEASPTIVAAAAPAAVSAERERNAADRARDLAVKLGDVVGGGARHRAGRHVPEARGREGLRDTGEAAERESSEVDPHHG